jgi:hypothetical protein
MQFVSIWPNRRFCSIFFDLKRFWAKVSTPEESDEGRSRMAGKLAILGAVGAAGLAALGGALMGYKYFFDPDEGAKRRNSVIGVAKSAASNYGLDGIGKQSMQKFMETLATAGR